jgi:hypothetical protein
MEKCFATLALIVLSVFYTPVLFAQKFLSVGPMLHVNFGNGKIKPSIGFEVAYWNYEHFPYSVDLGIDYEKSKFRIYSEAQTGIAVTGLSAGPFVEFKKDSPIQAGLQGSFWINYYVGVDCRFRIMKGGNYIAPGIYAKLPLAPGFLGNEENNESHSDWDWD